MHGELPVPAGATFHDSVGRSVVDESAEIRYARIVAEQFDFVWRSLRGLGVPPDRVDDAAQSVFVLLHRHLESVEREKERPYLFSVARGVASNERRMRARAPVAVGAEVLEAIVDPAAGPEVALQNKEARRFLDVALDALDEELRVVFVLFELEGLSTPEIARTLSIPTGTAASRLRRARETFSEICARIQRDIERGNLR